MAVTSLVLGILGIIIFPWLGIIIGVGCSTALSIGSSMNGSFEVIVWPIWVFGLFFGFVLPLAGIILGAVSVKNKKNGVAIGGIVTSCIAVIIGLVWTLVAGFGADLTKHGISHMSPDIKNQINQVVKDPQMQKQLKDTLKQIQDLQNTGGQPDKKRIPLTPVETDTDSKKK